jgi:Fungal chitosanase of glycosyl hydrolase group 75
MNLPSEQLPVKLGCQLPNNRQPVSNPPHGLKCYKLSHSSGTKTPSGHTDGTKALNDSARYVDASKIPYFVLPTRLREQVPAHLGDCAVVFNQQDLKSSPAIFADTGPTDRIVEGSIALAENLGLWSDARNGGTTRGFLYLVFPGSGNGSPRPAEEIQAEAETLFQDRGGDNQLTACGFR